MREPSDKEVQAYLQVFNDQVTYKEIAGAFWSGKEVRLRNYTSP